MACARPSCGQVFFLCRYCDRGHRYCGEVCVAEARRASLRDAGHRYQRSRDGRHAHAERQRRYRERRRKVTHHRREGPTLSTMVRASPASEATAAPLLPGVEEIHDGDLAGGDPGPRGGARARAGGPEGDGPEGAAARLRSPPAHPRALAALCEALALWSGEPVRAVLAAGAPDASFDTTRWLGPDGPSASALFELSVTDGARPRRRDVLGGFGDFRDVRQLVFFEVAE